MGRTEFFPTGNHFSYQTNAQRSPTGGTFDCWLEPQMRTQMQQTSQIGEERWQHHRSSEKKEGSLF